MRVRGDLRLVLFGHKKMKADITEKWMVVFGQVSEKRFCRKNVFIEILFDLFIFDLLWGSGPIPEVLQYRANPWW